MSSLRSGPGATLDLPRHLGLVDATAIYVGTILGSGIFVAPAAVSAAANGLVPAIAIWILGGVVAACGACCYAECASRLPATGGFYIFYREALGEPAAFLGGWAAIFITYPASIAAIALVLGRYLIEAAPSVAPTAAVSAAVALIAAGALNAIGVRTGVWAQRILTASKVLVLASLCLAAALSSGARPGAAAAETGSPIEWGALLGALVVVLWTYDGWSDITLVAGEVRDPKRDIGRTVIVGTAILVGLYALCQICIGVLLPRPEAAASERVVAAAVQSGLGEGAARAVALLVVASTFGAVNAVVLTVSRLGLAMARDAAIPRWIGALHPVWLTPVRSIAAIVVASLFYVAAAGFRNLVAVFSFTVWIFYGITAVVLLRLRRRGTGEAGGEGVWVAPGGSLAPVVVLATSVAMTTGLLIQSPLRSLASLAILAAGIPVYLIWKRAGRGR